MKHFILSIAIIILSCKENEAPDISDQTIEDSVNIVSKQHAYYEKEVLVERGNFEDEQFKVSVYSQFIIPSKISHDSSFYLKGNLLQVSEKKTNKILNYQLIDPCSFESRIFISNVTKLLRFKESIFEIATPDCSDWYISEFVVIKPDSIQKLFDISDSQPAILERSDETTLTGVVKNRDEIVGSFQDYAISISLDDFVVTINKPVKQSIGFLTEALETFQVSGLNARHSTQSYTLKKGEKLIVDSIFRDIKQVLIIIKDSISIYCPISEIKGKIQGNTAG